LSCHGFAVHKGHHVGLGREEWEREESGAEQNERELQP